MNRHTAVARVHECLRSCASAIFISGGILFSYVRVYSAIRFIRMQFSYRCILHLMIVWTRQLGDIKPAEPFWES